MTPTRDSILANKTGFVVEPIDIPEWGGKVYVRTLTAAERDQFEWSVYGQRDFKNFRARLLVLAVCDEGGERVFRDEDADALGRQPGQIIDRIWDVATRLSAVGADDVAALKKN